MKLWGGRFAKDTDDTANDFHSSISFDKRLYKQDIKGSKAHALMLGRQGIIPQEDAQLICAALDEILEDIESGKAQFDTAAEDIHMNIEKILTERIGEPARRLHTARSRNDQVATDMRMYIKETADEIIMLINALNDVLDDICRSHKDTIMPGYTHLQRAQPVTLALHLNAYAQMFMRDIVRFQNAKTAADCMPLGAAALAGTTYDIDRSFTAQTLGFTEISRNSLDAVSDRDFLADFLYASAVLMMHLSRFCEEIVLWASREFSFIELDDAYSTGSSIMPQKKNPDMAELIRGKTGRVYGSLISLLTVMKGLPLAYNKDMQEDKEGTFDAIDTLVMCLPVFTNMLKTTKFNADVMKDAASGGFTNATDAADWLVKKGVPFRDAHEIVGKLILYCEKCGKQLENLTLEEYKTVSDVFDDSVYDAISLEACVKARKQIQ